MQALHSQFSRAQKAHSNALHICVLLLCAAVLSACVGRPTESKQYRAVTPAEAVSLSLTAQTANNTQVLAANDNVHNVLALSGGGAYGAYGVGYLTGWTQKGTRPQFDVVTGVSTGALMSVFAFLGPQYDRLLEKLYTDVTERDIFTDKGVAGIFSDSLYDNTPLKKQIESVLTQNILDAVAAEHAKGRRLYVATTNLDAGQLVIWDMGKIASGGRSNPLQHFQKVLRASASIPAFFKPVYIKPQRGVQLRQAHVDGGVKAPVLIDEFLFNKAAPERNLYVIVNDSIAESDPVEAVKPNLASIAQKSIATLTRQLLIQTVKVGFARSKIAGADFYLTSVPDTLGLGNTSLSFDKNQMRRLFQAGKNAALSNAPWRRNVGRSKAFVSASKVN